MKTIALCTFMAVTALAGLTGCEDKNKANPESTAPSASVATPAASASGAPVASASGKAADAKSSGASWSGTYTLAAGTLSIPTDNKDYGNVKQIKDDPSKHMGDGKIDLSVDASGKVAGTLEGGAGPAVIDGALVGEEIRGTVRRKDPKDDGLTGTLTAKVAGDAAEGKLSLADTNTAIVREAKLVLKKK